MAFICDVIGNVLADEAAELTAKLLRPSQAKCKEVSSLDTEAFLVCVRIGLTQARSWEVLEDALVYEALVEFEPEATSVEIELVKATKSLAESGHDIVATAWGDMSGHRCSICEVFKCSGLFEYWAKGPRCTPKASGQSRKGKFESEQLAKRA